MSEFSEPWHGCDGAIFSENSEGISEVHNCGMNGSHSKKGYSYLRRIVACVNACAGISTEKLEENAADPIAGIFGRMAAREGQRADKAEAQRDELLSALKDLLDPDSDVDAGYKKAYDAIHRVENA